MLVETWWDKVSLLHVCDGKMFWQWHSGLWQDFGSLDIYAGIKSLCPAVADIVPVSLKGQLSWPGGYEGHDACWRADPGKFTKHSQPRIALNAYLLVTGIWTLSPQYRRQQLHCWEQYVWVKVSRMKVWVLLSSIWFTQVQCVPGSSSFAVSISS